MRAWAAVIGTLLVLTTGCGVQPQDRPERVAGAAPAPSVPKGELGTNGPEVTLFFVRGAVLAPVLRTANSASASAAVTLLTAGPTREEVFSGLRTALAPQPLTVDEGVPGGLTAVSVTRGFTGITGGNQLLAVAQIVWTITDIPGTTEVRFLLEGVPVEVPTDEGLTDQPVDRRDYASVAPAPPPPSPTSGEPTGDSEGGGGTSVPSPADDVPTDGDTPAAGTRTD